MSHNPTHVGVSLSLFAGFSIAAYLLQAWHIGLSSSCTYYVSIMAQNDIDCSFEELLTIFNFGLIDTISIVQLSNEYLFYEINRTRLKEI